MALLASFFGLVYLSSLWRLIMISACTCLIADHVENLGESSVCAPPSSVKLRPPGPQSRRYRSIPQLEGLIHRSFDLLRVPFSSCGRRSPVRLACWFSVQEAPGFCRSIKCALYPLDHHLHSDDGQYQAHQPRHHLDQVQL
jgi:hypothetical protein